MPSKTPPVSFDVLLRAPGGAATASVKTVRSFEPDPEAVERCRRWLAGRGVTCHAANFSLACSAPAKVFAKLFEVKIQPAARRGLAQAGVDVDGKITVPPEIADLVEQVTLTRPPEFFA